ncbi:MAG: hypothetical protein A3F61_03600 [Candidatus Blackburnbacteria bacterium RIFCSPHIGHO2_12_FULL_41_13b]|uniref:Fido domain-containing protein n=1 Tax=Candidatus Blackburnbacteria bacterium RIFCSPHIGHO2_12_FULL_41_13b TaxID=1797517 RepID=A0A1G1V781_9BACT|nr:MAG: hypothetical protein A3F61_03600 [Candidatus Blackburnbacteria bacterium RIFCSPHIGHO2_12_FULL_41_13b]
MSPRTYFLDIEQVLIIHTDQIERYGGSHGLRDLGLLESAVFRSQATFGKEDLYPSIFGKAAALFQSLVLNHPFIDGNKRTATASTLVFLEMNGYSVKVGQKVLVKFVLQIEKETLEIEQIYSWLKKNSKKV